MDIGGWWRTSIMPTITQTATEAEKGEEGESRSSDYLISDLFERLQRVRTGEFDAYFLDLKAYPRIHSLSV